MFLKSCFEIKIFSAGKGDPSHWSQVQKYIFRFTESLGYLSIKSSILFCDELITDRDSGRSCMDLDLFSKSFSKYIFIPLFFNAASALCRLLFSAYPLHRYQQLFLQDPLLRRHYRFQLTVYPLPELPCRERE